MRKEGREEREKLIFMHNEKDPLPPPPPMRQNVARPGEEERRKEEDRRRLNCLLEKRPWKEDLGRAFLASLSGPFLHVSSPFSRPFGSAVDFRRRHSEQ